MTLTAYANAYCFSIALQLLLAKLYNMSQDLANKSSGLWVALSYIESISSKLLSEKCMTT